MFRYSPKNLTAQGKTIITAHSGCEGTPDNSLEHIHAAIASGAEMLEVDLRMSTDGTLYLSHDVPEDIRQRPTLKDLFEVISKTENMEINLDAKTEGLIQPAVELADAYGLTQRILFTGSVARDRALAVSLGTDVWHNLERGETVQDGLRWILTDGCPCLNVHYLMVTRAQNEALRAHGHGFSVWTVNDEMNLRRCLNLGVTNITTRRPLLAMQLRKEIQGI